MRPASADVIDFEDLTLPSESFNNGSDYAGGFTSGGAQFNNVFTDFGGGFTSWTGFAYSNVTDNTTPGFGNQHSAFAGSGAGGSENYAVSFGNFPGDAVIDLPEGRQLLSADFTNTTYAALSMRDGDSFAKKFGGVSGFDPDFFLLEIIGLDGDGNEIGSVPFYLADYRAAGTGSDYIVSDWVTVDLSSLAAAVSLTFALSSSDNDPLFGMNTPGYFAIDNIKFATEVVPEAGSLALGGLAVVLGLALRYRQKLAAR
jgi:hypothetical protein